MKKYMQMPMAVELVRFSEGQVNESASGWATPAKMRKKC